MASSLLQFEFTRLARRYVGVVMPAACQRQAVRKLEAVLTRVQPWIVYRRSQVRLPLHCDPQESDSLQRQLVADVVDTACP